MYSEIELIQQIPDRQTQIEMLLLFVGEYAGWIQHLREIGGVWGANGEQVGAGKEIVKVEAHISKLRTKILSLTRESTKTRNLKRKIVANEQQYLFREVI